MAANKFIIDNRFVVDSCSNVITDKTFKADVHVEPRLMTLLCILAENNGCVVTRQKLIAEIWNNYGGAEEGLNQAVSFLRKALKDHNKRIIETVPKKGYCLKATLQQLQTTTKTQSPARTEKTWRRVSASAFFLILIIFMLPLLRQKAPTTVKRNLRTAVRLTKPSGKTVDFEQLNKSSLENDQNAISTTGPDGKRYKLVVIGDTRPQFYINDLPVPDSARDRYTELEGKLAKALWSRSAKTGALQ